MAKELFSGCRQAVTVKKETECIEEMPSSLKVEPEWETEGDAAALAKLYAGHVVKDELVLGPEIIQEKDVGFSIHVKDSRKVDIPLASRSKNSSESKGCSLKKKENKEEKNCKVKKNEDENCDIENEKDLIKCETCNKIFVSQNNLTKHKRIHAGEKPYTCKICNKGFVQNDYLKRHEKIHSEKQFKCANCSKQYSDRSNLNRHMRYHKGQKLYTCETCGKQFGQRIHLITHQFTHTEQKPYFCDTCQKQFTFKHRLVAHKRIHTGEKPYRCQICPIRFIAQCRLTRHEVLVHGGRFPYHCEKQKLFKTKKELNY